MRVKPLIGEQPWFGPRRGGWGWSPVTWQGWAVIAFVLVAVLGATVARNGIALAGSVAVLPLLMLLIVLKGTSPGGPAAWKTFQRFRAGELDEAAAEAEPATRSKLARMLLVLGGVVVAGVVASLLLITVAPGAIAPPASVHVGSDRLHVDMRGPYAVYALRRGVSVPLSAIRSARYAAHARDLPRGARFGTYIPGGLIAGSFGHGSARTFWVLQHDGAVVIDLTGESFSSLVVEVRDPTAVLRDLAAAGVPTR